VIQTLEREEIWNIQTPQAFWTDRLRDVHERAVVDGIEGTDDAQLIEHYGGRVAVVEGHTDAFKVTKPGDVERAGALAERSRR
jgi:2-C-methyl-D-erythritol 4-phosphate cytidylyltransferase